MLQFTLNAVARKAQVLLLFSTFLLCIPTPYAWIYTTGLCFIKKKGKALWQLIFFNLLQNKEVG